MKLKDVPQDKSVNYESQLRAVYAQDEQGRMVVTTTNGWDVEELVTQQAVDEFDRCAAEARQRWSNGDASALEVHMHALRMDVPTLAQATGIWQWRVRRHLQPTTFAQLKPALLSRYAEAMGMSVSALQHVDASHD
ncbi:MAG: hypothetical protein ACSHXK_00675 [Oceanococcus sp.]